MTIVLISIFLSLISDRVDLTWLRIIVLISDMVDDHLSDLGHISGSLFWSWTHLMMMFLISDTFEDHYFDLEHI